MGQPKEVMEVQAITLLEEVGLSEAIAWINILICYQVERRNVLRLRVQYVLTLKIYFV